MDDYSFIAGTPPSTFQFAFEETLFNQEKHRWLQSAKNWQSFYMINQRQIVASIHFHVSDHIAQSPLRAPYGSMEFSEIVSDKNIKAFMLFFQRKLERDGIKQLIIKSHPAIYAATLFPLEEEIFDEDDFEVLRVDIHSAIRVNNNDFSKALHRSEKKRLRKCNHAGFFVRQLSLDSLEQVYTFIADCRATKRFTISMSLSELKNACEIFPNHYLFFGVFKGDEMIAASVCIRISKTILYDYAHDHKMDYNSFSPVVLLIEGIYRFCQENNIDTLDLGTSISEGVMKESLLEFKKRLGAVSCEKITWSKSYEQ